MQVSKANQEITIYFYRRKFTKLSKSVYRLIKSKTEIARLKYQEITENKEDIAHFQARRKGK